MISRRRWVEPVTATMDLAADGPDAANRPVPRQLLDLQLPGAVLHTTKGVVTMKEKIKNALAWATTSTLAAFSGGLAVAG